MTNQITFLHPYKFGDLISFLAGCQHLHETSGTKSLIYQRLGMPAYYDNDEDQCMGYDVFSKLKPLLESQDYIAAYKDWNGEKVDIDLTKSMDSKLIPIPNSPIQTWHWALNPQMQCNLTIPWIHVDEHFDNRFRDKILINRSSRYQNPYISYHFLKPHENKLIFTGLRSEHEAFCNSFNLDIPFLEVENFLALAQIIKTVKFTVSNQSPVFHIADAQKSLRLLECSTLYPNTYPTGSDGYFFLHQESLEIQFEKLINA